MGRIEQIIPQLLGCNGGMIGVGDAQDWATPIQAVRRRASWCTVVLRCLGSILVDVGFHELNNVILLMPGQIMGFVRILSPGAS